MEDISSKRLIQFTITAAMTLFIIANVFGIGCASATVQYDDTHTFTGSASTTLGATKEGGNPGIVYSSVITSMSFDFTSIKSITLIKSFAAMGYCVGSSGCSYDGTTYGYNTLQNNALPSANVTTIVTKLVPFTATVDGITYGYGAIGWQKTPPTTSATVINYYISFEYINSAYANTLSGVKTVVFTYNTTVFSDYWYYNTLCTYGCGGFPTAGTLITLNTIDGKTTSGITTVNSTTSDSIRVTFDTNGSTFGYYNVTKNNANFHTNLSDASSVVIDERTSTLDFSNYVMYSSGLNLKIKHVLLNQWYNTTLADATGTFVAPEIPETPLVVDPITGVAIQFNTAEYALNDVANISWLRTINTPLFCTDYIRKTLPGDATKIELIKSPANSGFIKQSLGVVGVHGVTFERECPLQPTKILGSDTATVVSDAASNIFASSPQGAGIPFNVTYSFGYTPLVQGELNSIVIEKLTGDIWAQNTAHSLNQTIVKGVEYNKTIVLGDVGKYKIKLFELSRGFVAYVIVDALAVDYIPAPLNITTSIITVDKVEYLSGDPLTIYYAIDNTNYSGYYSKYISIIHASGTYPESKHVVLTKQQDIINYADGVLQTTQKGLNYVQLRAKNATADILITNTSLNVSFIDDEGYGLDIVDPEICKNEFLIIKYATPGASTLRVDTVVDDGFPKKYYQVNITGSGSISLKLTQATDYHIIIYEGFVGNIKKFSMAKATDCEAAATPTPPQTSDQMQSSITNMLTSNIFWALIIIVGLMLAVAVETRSRGRDAIMPMAIVGFMGMSVFTMIGWMPAWILVSTLLIAVVTFAWSQAKNMNTGGQ